MTLVNWLLLGGGFVAGATAACGVIALLLALHARAMEAEEAATRAATSRGSSSSPMAMSAGQPASRPPHDTDIRGTNYWPHPSSLDRARPSAESGSTSSVRPPAPGHRPSGYPYQGPQSRFGEDPTSNPSGTAAGNQGYQYGRYD